MKKPCSSACMSHVSHPCENCGKQWTKKKPVFVEPPKSLTFNELCNEIEDDSGDWIHDCDMGDR